MMRNAIMENEQWVFCELNSKQNVTITKIQQNWKRKSHLLRCFVIFGEDALFLLFHNSFFNHSEYYRFVLTPATVPGNRRETILGVGVKTF